MKKIISRCPVCGGELVVTRLKCNSCETVIEIIFGSADSTICRMRNYILQRPLSAAGEILKKWKKS